MKKFIIAFIILFSTNIYAQVQNMPNISIKNKKTIIDTVLACFKGNYVYPEVAKTLEDSLVLNAENGNYSNIKETEKFLNQLSYDLKRISGDNHIGIKYIENSDYEVRQSKHSLLSDKLNEKKKKNFNFRKVEWLPGNVGYLRFDRFEDPQYAGSLATSTINFLSNCDAIIIDLRYNYGGEEKMVRYLSSYFFSEPTLLNNRYFTKQDSTVQSWTDAYIPIKSLIDKDVYILTSSNTASGAEAFTYILKNYKKAIVIGETTKGAAHWVEYFNYPSLNIEIKLPVARPINPITKTSWEKTGVIPDIEIHEYNAFDKAYVIALDNLLINNANGSKVQELEWYKTIAEEKLKNEITSISDFIEYSGKYEDIEFFVKDKYLFWRQDSNVEFILLSISQDHFVFDDSDDYIVKFVRDEKNEVTGYQLLIKNRIENPIHNKIRISGKN